MSNPKSLMQWICESIDEELRERTGLNGHDIYMRGFLRCEKDALQRAVKRLRKELAMDAPLLTPDGPE